MVGAVARASVALHNYEEPLMPLFRYCPRCGAPLAEPAAPPERTLRQDCAACGAVHYRNAKPTASALVIRDGQVLLGRRAVEPLRGWWDIPGGFLEPWEEPLVGVRREVREETGLEITPTAVLAILVDTYDDPATYTLNVYYLAEVVGGQLRAADDVAELRWFAPSELPNVAFASGREALRRWAARRLAGLSH
jgi:ADP-ribose pyrophosphatase YjhB (NUDIX family)